MTRSSKKVLIVDDEESLRSSIAFKLREHGFDVLEAVDGVDGLAQATEQHPDLILLDIIMPHKNGIDMLKDLRSDEWGKDARVIILSNSSDAQYIAEAVQLGVFDHFVKVDWDIEDIVKVINEKLCNIN